MIDKITAKIKRYPFQTGIIVGVIACLLLVGFVSLFQDHGQTLAGNSEIIQEDYLRMTMNEFNRNSDAQLAGWRYKHLGGKAGEVLKLMQADQTISPQLLAGFAEAVNGANLLRNNPDNGNGQNAAGTPTNPRKGLSGFGKVLLVILCLGVLAAGGFYAASMIKTKNKQKRRSEVNNQHFNEEPVSVITPDKARAVQDNANDTLFDLDSLFPQGGETKAPENEPVSVKIPSLENVIPDEPVESDDSQASVIETLDSEKDEEKEYDAGEPEVQEKNEESNDGDSDFPHLSEITSEADSTEEKSKDVGVSLPEPESEGDEEILIEQRNESGTDDGMEIEERTYSIDYTEEKKIIDEQPEEEQNLEPLSEQKPGELLTGLEPKNADVGIREEPENAQDDDAEKPLVETDPDSEPESEDELLKMIRAGKPETEAVSAIVDLPESSKEIAQQEVHESVTKEMTETIETGSETDEKLSQEENESETQTVSDDDILIHYQSQYRIGNDMYDEVFSIDQGDIFRGECGIGIGETLNNTEPKAVTAFEVWLFDKDDIHTATWYLMSDFALENQGISSRLAQRGKCDRIRKGDLYTLETETLLVEIKILEVEYGSEMEEKNSYFTNVVFDVIARNKLDNYGS